MNQRKVTLFMISVLLLCLSANGALAQEKPKSAKKQYKAFMKLQDERDAQTDDNLDKKRKKHNDLQTKQTRKRMKQQKRKSARIQKGKHPETFFQRLFKKKPKGR